MSLSHRWLTGQSTSFMQHRCLHMVYWAGCTRTCRTDTTLRHTHLLKLATENAVTIINPEYG
jgi:hypothetical protein